MRVAVGWWRRRGWLSVDPTGDLMRRREQVDRTRALTRGQLEGLFARRDLALRERTLWRLLYETAARSQTPWPTNPRHEALRWTMRSVAASLVSRSLGRSSS